jgi:AraC family transcriptional regulator of adaptative response/methylated-DNA-[protein]-cysteine methyltransferase
MTIGSTDSDLYLLELSDRKMLPAQLSRLEKSLPATLTYGTNALIEQTAKELKEYFDGTRKQFDVPLGLTGTPFQQKAWEALLSIPYGTTRSYKQQAHAIGNSKSVRAIARANGDNRIAIMIPCHRIIGSDGSPVGYGGGIERKQWLLKHEFEHQ